MIYNSFRNLIIFFIALFIVLLITEKSFAQSSELFVGVSEVDITPPVGYAQYRGESTGIYDPLFAKAIVFQQGDEQAALVVCDLISITRDFSIEVRTAASELTGIPYANIIVAATHTHTGPRYHAEINEYIERKRSGEMRSEDENSYEAQLLQAVIESIVKADQAAIQVIPESGSAYAEGLAFNRRYIMKDGRVRFNPGVGNPDVIRPVGPVDPEVGIILFRRATDDHPTGSLTSFANHTDTVGGMEFTADYPGYLARSLANSMGDDFVSIFGMGTSGDLNHIDVIEASHQEGSESVTQRIGESLAAAFKEEIPNLNRADNPLLAVRSEFIYAPLQEYTEEELQWALKEESGLLYEERTFLKNMRKRKIRSLENMRSSGEAIPPTVGTGKWTLPVEVQVIQVGENAAIVGLPGEVFVELGMAIKRNSPFETTLVVELTNSGIAYVPTKEAFAQGDYETVNSRLAAGGGELMVESAVRMLNELNDILSH